jgi:hypothetical protein
VSISELSDEQCNEAGLTPRPMYLGVVLLEQIRAAIRKLLSFWPKTLALWHRVFRIIPATKNMFERAYASD